MTHENTRKILYCSSCHRCLRCKLNYRLCVVTTFFHKITYSCGDWWRQLSNTTVVRSIYSFWYSWHDTFLAKLTSLESLEYSKRLKSLLSFTATGFQCKSVNRLIKPKVKWNSLVEINMTAHFHCETFNITLKFYYLHGTNCNQTKF